MIRRVSLDTQSLERLVPADASPGAVTGEDSLQLSLSRYAFAARHVRPGRLLDIACGVGFGAPLLAQESEEDLRILGVDVSDAAIRHAREHYSSERVSFTACDAMDFSDPDGFDTIVSIETIEHLPDPLAFVDRMVRMLRPNGALIASVPITPSVDANPHHLSDFSERSFRRLFEGRGLRPVADFRQDQPFRLGAVLKRSEPRMQGMRRNLGAYYLSHPRSLARRVASTLRHGFKNKYLTIAWRVSG